MEGKPTAAGSLISTGISRHGLPRHGDEQGEQDAGGVKVLVKDVLARAAPQRARMAWRARTIWRCV